MKSTKRNEQLQLVLDNVQQAARQMSYVMDNFSEDKLLGEMFPGKDELAFEELNLIAEEVQEKLLRIVPQMRLLISAR